MAVDVEANDGTRRVIGGLTSSDIRFCSAHSLLPGGGRWSDQPEARVNGDGEYRAAFTDIAMDRAAPRSTGGLHRL